MYRNSSVRSRSYSPAPRSRSRPTSGRRVQQQQDPRGRSPDSFSTRGPPPGGSSSRPPTSPRDTRSGGPPGKSNRRSRAYPAPLGVNNNGHSPPRRKKEITMVLSVFHSSSHRWSTAPLTFRPDRINDRELWEDIRDVFRTELQSPWKRIFGFDRVKNIVPIAYSSAMVPLRTNPDDFPESRQLVHAYHRPESVRTDHKWVDHLTHFDAGDTRQNGFEFIEGLWAEKLAAVAVVASVAIVVVSIVWCVRGGQLQTVFTVMGFVLTFVAALIALLALYYQIAGNNSGSSS